MEEGRGVSWGYEEWKKNSLRNHDMKKSWGGGGDISKTNGINLKLMRITDQKEEIFQFDKRLRKIN